MSYFVQTYLGERGCGRHGGHTSSPQEMGHSSGAWASVRVSNDLSAGREEKAQREDFSSELTAFLKSYCKNEIRCCTGEGLLHFHNSLFVDLMLSSRFVLC